MTDVIKMSRKIFLHRQTLRFLLVGCTTVLIDYLTYQIFIYIGLSISLAKGLSFCTGAVFAFFANRSLTFEIAGKPSSTQFFRFALLYSTTLGLNVLCNRLMLNVMPQIFPKFQVQIAFLFATGTSTVTNFLGMKFVVFQKAAAKDEAQ